MLVDGHPQRPLIVDIGGDPHQSVVRTLLKGLDIAAELSLREHCVDGGEDERAIEQMAADLEEAVHRRGGALDDEAQGYPTALQAIALDGRQVGCHLAGGVVTDAHNLVGIVLHKDTYQAVYQALAAHPDQGFGLADALGCQPATLPCCNNGELHFLLDI